MDKRAYAEGWRFLDRAEISHGNYATGRKTRQGHMGARNSPRRSA